VRIITRAELQARRDANFRRTPGLKINSRDDALAFINRVGMCLLYSSGDLELPNVNDALTASAQSRLWGWKDELPAERAVHYAKVVRDKPGFISLDMLPNFMALHPASLPGQYAEAYLQGRLSRTANVIAEALAKDGAASTKSLRRDLGLMSKEAEARFTAALDELQGEFIIAKVGASGRTRHNYTYVWDLLCNWMPEAAALAALLAPADAMAAVLRKYLSVVVCAPFAGIVRLFEWSPGHLEEVVAAEQQAGRVEQVMVEGEEAAWPALTNETS
jgi:hypothetical protein